MNGLRLCVTSFVLGQMCFWAGLMVWQWKEIHVMFTNWSYIVIDFIFTANSKHASDHQYKDAVSILKNVPSSLLILPPRSIDNIL